MWMRVCLPLTFDCFLLLGLLVYCCSFLNCPCHCYTHIFNNKATFKILSISHELEIELRPEFKISNFRSNCFGLQLVFSICYVSLITLILSIPKTSTFVFPPFPPFICFLLSCVWDDSTQTFLPTHSDAHYSPWLRPSSDAYWWVAGGMSRQPLPREEGEKGPQ